MAVSPHTLRKLFTLSGNKCAFPGCTAPVLDTTHDVVTGQVCHIKAKSPGGPRYDPAQTPDERDGYDNLILMCAAHNKIIDDSKTWQGFTVEMLTGYKREHEARFRNAVVKEDDLEYFVKWVLQLRSSATPTVTLAPVLESVLRNVDHQAGLDYYDFTVSLPNDNDTTVREYGVDVEVPRRYMQGGPSYTAEVDSPTPNDTKLFRHTQDNFRGREIYPDSTMLVFKLSFTIQKDWYRTGVPGFIRVSVYTGGRRVSRTDYPIADLLSDERRRQILGE